MSASGKKVVSLRVTLFTAFLCTVLFTTFFNAWISSLHVRNLVSDSIREKLAVAVGIGAMHINGDLHQNITDHAQQNSTNFRHVFAQLEKIRKINPDIKNVYTIRKISDDKVVFVVDADPQENERAQVGRPLIEITPAIRDSFVEGTVKVENRYFTDEWGTFVSGFAPFYRSDGTLEGLLGMDVMAETVKTHQMNNILAILFTSLVVTIVSVFLSLIISREIANPIAGVTADMGRIKDFNLGCESVSVSRIHEIQQMNDALDSMKKGLRSFKKYVPTQLVSDLIKLKKEAALEVESRNITILFSDIRDFTTISEKITPEELAETINLYFAEFTRTIMETGGIVDKFIGDAIMALWGTPHDMPDHPLSACKAALACRQRESELNRILKEKGLPELYTRMGINTGDALVGNIGFDERLSYTALGDSVNLASRLEGVNKLYNTGIIISESTYTAVKDEVIARFIDVVVVKGKSKGVRIYELLSLRENASPDLVRQTEAYNMGMELYISRQWPKALAILSDLSREKKDNSCDMLIDRCRRFIENPPGDDFVGIVTLRNK